MKTKNTEVILRNIKIIRNAAKARHGHAARNGMPVNERQWSRVVERCDHLITAITDDQLDEADILVTLIEHLDALIGVCKSLAKEIGNSRVHQFWMSHAAFLSEVKGALESKLNQPSLL